VSHSSPKCAGSPKKKKDAVGVSLTVDPFDPTNGLQPLIFNIGSIPTFTFGDVLFYDPATDALSDVLRFEQGSSSTILVVYSNRAGPGSIADVGLPGVLQTNQIIETQQLIGHTYIDNYVPTLASQPGFVSGSTYTYEFQTFVPEPASLGLFAISAIGLMAGRSSRRRLVRR
jgi:hypothetical protein